jgi:hypothetical protein
VKESKESKKSKKGGSSMKEGRKDGLKEVHQGRKDTSPNSPTCMSVHVCVNTYSI